ncbi:MAG TPA: HlyD family secretion protein [Syntrophorhabdaceae bacterium]|nr:HlyD family secretion protein [Syntrophorhabdaceae bacterium]
MRKWSFRVLIILAILAALVYSIARFVHSLSHETTDDAYTAGVIVPIAAEVKGRVVNVYVDDNKQVTAGMLLLEIFPEDYMSTLTEKKETVSRFEAEERELRALIAEKKRSLTQAEANVEANRADETLAAKELKRYENLRKEDVVSASQYDNAEGRFKVARARRDASEAALAETGAALETAQARLTTQGFKIKEAEASLDRAQLDLKRTFVRAPVSGTIAKKNVDAGKYVQPGQPLLSIVEGETWIIANFKETQIKKMAIGQPVEVKVDAYPGITFKGHVDSLQPGTGSVFSLLPPENATGNFVKVVQRVPVKIVMESKSDNAHPLWPGLSVIPTVDVSRATGPKLSSSLSQPAR